MLQRMLQPGRGTGLALLQQSAQHALHSIKQVSFPQRVPYSSSSSNNSRTNKPDMPQYHHLQLQAAAMQDIENLLPAGTVQRTSKGCRANLGFSLGSALHLPLQVKAGTVRDNRVTFRLPGWSEEGVMPLLVYRPYPCLGQTLVTTHCMIPKGRFDLSLTEGTKYYPFLVPDGLLPDTMAGMYKAVLGGRSDATLPSGKVLDISGLKLMSLGELSVPTVPSVKRAREFYLLRRQWLPALDIQVPSTLYTAVDAIIKGARISDVVATLQAKTQGSYLANNKKQCFKGKVQPLQEGAFDALWVFHPDRVHFWLIPAQVLVGKGFLATAHQQGKYGLLLYDQDYYKPQQGKGADLWTQQYLLDSRDPGLMEKVMQVLKAIKRSS